MPRKAHINTKEKEQAIADAKMALKDNMPDTPVSSEEREQMLS